MDNNIRPLTPAQIALAETELVARAAIHGFPVDVDPDLADHMGAFEETAINLSDAEETLIDVDEDLHVLIDQEETPVLVVNNEELVQ